MSFHTSWLRLTLRYWVLTLEFGGRAAEWGVRSRERRTFVPVTVMERRKEVEGGGAGYVMYSIRGIVQRWWVEVNWGCERSEEEIC